MRLQTKIISTVIIITTSLNLIVEFRNLQNFSWEEYEKLNNKIEVTGQLLQKTVSNPIYNLDYELTNENLQLYFTDPDIKSIQLIDKSDITNIFLDHEEIGLENSITQLVVVDYRGIELGDITIVYTKQNIIKRIREAIIDIIITKTILMLIISIVIYLILNRMINPIKKLTELSVEISNGNLEKDIDITSNDEVGILTESFIHMKNSIKEQIDLLKIENSQKVTAEKRLLELNTNLEEKVHERTIELEAAFDNLKFTQSQLIESEKMALLGNLVAGVTHEINTPIGIGVTAASHLKDEVSKFKNLYLNNKITKSSLEEYLNSCEEISEILLSNMLKGSELIRSFKNIAVDQSSEVIRDFEIKEYLGEILMSIRSKFKRTAYKISLECNDGVIVKSYPGALSQVITNLLMNTLMHGFEELDEGEVFIDVVTNRENLVITYSDTGCGIPQKNIDKIFTPFYTTKRGHGGSGLGLSIVYNLVTTTLGGRITCSSELGEGTTFIITLPETVKKNSSI